MKKILKYKIFVGLA